MKHKLNIFSFGKTPQQIREAEEAKAARILKWKQRRRMTPPEYLLWLLLLVYVVILGFHMHHDIKGLLDEYYAQIVGKTHILSAGDVMFHSPMIDTDTYHKEDGSYDFSDIFTYIKDDYAEADYTVLNLEVTLSDQGYYSGHPLFITPYTLAATLKDASVDLCLLANNHIYDNREDGMQMTREILSENELDYTGIRQDTSESTYMIKELDGIKIGIMNYTYELGSSNGHKGINTITVKDETAPLINSFNYEDIKPFYDEVEKTLTEMTEAGVDVTIAYLHWGTEYRTYENELQQRIAQSLCDRGVDILIGGHPHVIQPVDLLTSTTGDHQMICAYSTGNHLSNQRREYMEDCPDGHSEDGLMVDLKFEKNRKGDTMLTSVEFKPTWAYRLNHSDTSRSFYIFPHDAPKEILAKYQIEQEITASIQRTNEIIAEGNQKIQSVLPLTLK